MPGTVTLVQLQPGADTSYRAFYDGHFTRQPGERAATGLEVAHACRAAVERWFS